VFILNNYIIRDELYPIIDKALTKKENQLKLKQAVESYLDRNHDKLSTLGPTYRIIFGGEDRNKLYDALEVSPYQIKEIVAKSDYIKGSWVKISDPFNVACVLAIRYATINKLDTLKDQLLIYFILSLYPSLHFKYFRYECVDNIMNYTINNLSNKYKIKQQGTIYFALYETMKVSHENEISDITECTDKDIVDYVNSAQTRLNSMLKNISNEYYKNHKDQLYLNVETDIQDETKYQVADSNIYSVDKLTNQVLLKLLVDGPNIKWIDLSANCCSVSTNELRNYINSSLVISNKDDIKSIIESILFLYLFNEQNKVEDISSNKFFAYCNELYRKSNTTDKNIIKIKSILDKWLQNVEIYKKTQRLATINNFRKAIYLFFVLTIQTINNS
jgi:hypothetical protein